MLHIVFKKTLTLTRELTNGSFGNILLVHPRSQGLFLGLGAGREKALALAGHVPTIHPEILGVIN